MKKRYRLRKEVKNILKTLLIGIMFLCFFFSFIIWGIDRIDRINNGEMVVISESYMD